MDTLRFLDILGFVVGLVYLVLEYKASIWLWLASIVMPAIDMVLYFKAGLYADFGMAIYYCLAGVYGYLSWKWFKRSGQQEEQRTERPVTRYKREHILPSIRLANVRDGIEDGELLKMMADEGRAAAADAACRKLITDLKHFSRDPAALRSARESLLAGQ